MRASIIDICHRRGPLGPKLHLDDAAAHATIKDVDARHFPGSSCSRDSRLRYGATATKQGKEKRDANTIDLFRSDCGIACNRSDPRDGAIPCQCRISRGALHTAFCSLEESAMAAIAKNGMNLVNRASASDGANGQGVTHRGDAVLGVFRNDFAVRMLWASVDAGIEAPIRLHLVEEPYGNFQHPLLDWTGASTILNSAFVVSPQEL